MDHPDMKKLREVLASVEALKRDLEELGGDVQVKISVKIPLEDMERES